MSSATGPEIDRGRSYTFVLPSAPFPDAARDAGYTLDDGFYDRDDHYADSSVSVFVPPRWKPRGRVDLVFFFHGWMSSREDAIAGFDLFDQFSASGIKALLVVPETAVNAPDSFGGKFEDSGGFERFVSDLLDTLDADDIVPGAQVGRIVLAGHSGGYRVIAAILRRGGLTDEVREVWLFDALYARESAFADWISSRRGRFVCVSSRGSDTVENADSLASILRARGVAMASAEDSDGDEIALGGPVVFLTSDADHFGVVHDHSEFKDFLETSAYLGERHRPVFIAARTDDRLRLAEGASSAPAPGRQ